MSQHQPENPQREPVAWTVRKGMSVVTFDGDTIGRVESASGDTFEIRKGHLFAKDYTIPASAIENVAPDAVHLKVTKEIVQSAGWKTSDRPDLNDPGGPTVSLGDPDVVAPVIGTFAADETGTFTASTVTETQVQRDVTDAIRDTDLATAGVNADAEEIPSNPIATGAVAPESGLPSAAQEPARTREADASLAEHDETLDEGFDAQHLMRHPSPLPAMDAPLPPNDAEDAEDASSDKAPGSEIADEAAVANEAVDPGLSENTPSEAESQFGQ